MSSWEDVKNLEELCQLNLKIAMDALDDAVEYCEDCRRNLEEAMKNLNGVREDEK